jgi:hypothetical protein
MPGPYEIAELSASDGSTDRQGGPPTRIVIRMSIVMPGGHAKIVGKERLGQRRDKTLAVLADAAIGETHAGNRGVVPTQST